MNTIRDKTNNSKIVVDVQAGLPNRNRSKRGFTTIGHALLREAAKRLAPLSWMCVTFIADRQLGWIHSNPEVRAGVRITISELCDYTSRSPRAVKYALREAECSGIIRAIDRRG